MLTYRYERLNALAKIISAATYLEIGVAKGETFSKVDIPFKIGVDPKFQFNINDYTNQHTLFHNVKSDIFFSRFASKYSKFDLIYLDGLHTFEQTFRDFCSSLRYSHAKTIWLIDDTYPSSWLASWPNHTASQLVRRLFFSRDRRWMGDVFKVVLAIHDFFPQYSYATFSGHGQTAVWLSRRKDFTPTWNSLKKIRCLGYFEFLQLRESHLLIMEGSKIIESIKKDKMKER